MKELSVSGVITNSSTEVFTIYSKNGLKEIKKLVTSILQITSDYSFDDFFDIDLEYNLDTVAELWMENYAAENPGGDSETAWNNFEASATKEELLNLAIEYDEQTDDGSPIVDGFTVTAKEGFEDVEKLKEVIKNINYIDNIFDHIDRYC